MFRLKGVNENATLIITGVSVETYETKLNGRTELVLNLKTKVNALNEVMINKGYYSTSQRFNTGSVAKVTSEEIEEQPISNPLAAIEGRIPGLIVTQSSGIPGSSFKLELRGRNSIAQGNDPYIVIDGVPFAPNNGNINQLGAGFYIWK